MAQDTGTHEALMHERDDAVAVVLIDVAKGEAIRVVTLSGDEYGSVEARDDIPLGHKIAVCDVADGADVVKYGRAIGSATTRIVRGDHVHTQNVKSKRWA